MNKDISVNNLIKRGVNNIKNEYINQFFANLTQEEKDIVIYIINGKADLAIDGYFLESKKTCYLNNKEKQYNSIILSLIFLTISMLTVIAALSTNILIMNITFISLIIVSIYILKIRCRIDINNNQKFLRYFIVVFIHWMLFITLCLNPLS